MAAIQRKILLAGAFALLLVASPALALDDIAIGAQSPVAEGDCPTLTKIKYPWATCTPSEYGGVRLGGQQTPPLECRMRLRDGSCAADPRPWQRVPVIVPGT